MAIPPTFSLAAVPAALLGASLAGLPPAVFAQDDAADDAGLAPVLLDPTPIAVSLARGTSLILPLPAPESRGSDAQGDTLGWRFADAADETSIELAGGRAMLVSGSGGWRLSLFTDADFAGSATLSLLLEETDTEARLPSDAALVVTITEGETMVEAPPSIPSAPTPSSGDPADELADADASDPGGETEPEVEASSNGGIADQYDARFPVEPVDADPAPLEAGPPAPAAGEPNTPANEGDAYDLYSDDAAGVDDGAPTAVVPTATQNDPEALDDIETLEPAAPTGEPDVGLDDGPMNEPGELSGAPAPPGLDTPALADGRDGVCEAGPLGPSAEPTSPNDVDAEPGDDIVGDADADMADDDAPIDPVDPLNPLDPVDSAVGDDPEDGSESVGDEPAVDPDCIVAGEIDPTGDVPVGPAEPAGDEIVDVDDAGVPDPDLADADGADAPDDIDVPADPVRADDAESRFGLRLVLASERAIVLAWNGGPQASYVISRDGEALDTVSDARFVDAGVVAGVSYRYEVSHGADGGSSALEVTAEDVGVGADAVSPVPPGELRAMMLPTGGVLVAWSAGGDDRAIAGYDLYRDGTYLMTLAANAHVDAEAADGAITTYEVVAFDAARNYSARSRAVLVDGTLPAVPSDRPAVQLAPTVTSGHDFVPVNRSTSVVVMVADDAATALWPSAMEGGAEAAGFVTSDDTLDVYVLAPWAGESSPSALGFTLTSSGSGSRTLVFDPTDQPVLTTQ